MYTLLRSLFPIGRRASSKALKSTLHFKNIGTSVEGLGLKRVFVEKREYQVLD